MGGRVKINKADVKAAFVKMRAVYRYNNWRILQVLYENGPMTVKEIQFTIKCSSHSTVSSWLKELRDVGIVDRFTDSKYRVYYIVDEEAARINRAAHQLTHPKKVEV